MSTHFGCKKTVFSWEKLNPGGSKPGCFPLFSGKVQIVSRTLSGLFLVRALNSPRKRKRTNRENPRTIPEQIGKIPEKIGKVPKRMKKDKKGRTSPDRETPPFSGAWFSKWCFSDSSPRLATEENPFKGRKNAWKNTNVLKHFGAFYPCRSWPHSEHHSEKHRLEKKVYYSLVFKR